MSQPTLLSVLVGLPADHGHAGATHWALKPWRTGYYKQEQPGPVRVDREAMEGNGQVVLGPHGGPDRVVLAYSAAHYPLWREEFPDFEFPWGAFGENFVVAGLDETRVCIGDIVAVGDTRLQVTMPRAPCAAISRRCGIASLLSRVQATQRIGWLYRVLQEGHVKAGDTVQLIERPAPDWPITRAYAVYLGLRTKDPAIAPEARAMADAPGLAVDWRTMALSDL